MLSIALLLAAYGYVYVSAEALVVRPETDGRISLLNSDSGLDAVESQLEIVSIDSNKSASDVLAPIDLETAAGHHHHHHKKHHHHHKKHHHHGGHKEGHKHHKHHHKHHSMSQIMRYSGSDI